LSKGGEKHVIKRNELKGFIIDLINEFPEEEFNVEDVSLRFKKEKGITLKKSSWTSAVARLFEKGLIDKNKYIGSPFIYIKKAKSSINLDKKSNLKKIIRNKEEKIAKLRDKIKDLDEKNKTIKKLSMKIAYLTKVNKNLENDKAMYNTDILQELDKRNEQLSVLKKKLNKFEDQEKKIWEFSKSIRKLKEENKRKHNNNLIERIEKQRTKIIIQEIKLKDLQEQLELSYEKKLDGLWICPEKHYIFEREKLLVDSQDYFICKKCKCAYRWHKWKFYPISKGDFEKEIAKLIPKLSSLVDLELIDLNKIPLQINL